MKKGFITSGPFSCHTVCNKTSEVVHLILENLLICAKSQSICRIRIQHTLLLYLKSFQMKIKLENLILNKNIKPFYLI